MPNDGTRQYRRTPGAGIFQEAVLVRVNGTSQPDHRPPPRHHHRLPRRYPQLEPHERQAPPTHRRYPPDATRSTRYDGNAGRDASIAAYAMRSPRAQRHERTIAPDDAVYGSASVIPSSRRTASSGKRMCSARFGVKPQGSHLPAPVAQSYHALRHVNQADGERGCAPIIEWGSVGVVSLLWMQADDVPPQDLSASLSSR